MVMPTQPKRSFFLRKSSTGSGFCNVFRVVTIVWGGVLVVCGWSVLCVWNTSSLTSSVGKHSTPTTTFRNAGGGSAVYQVKQPIIPGIPQPRPKEYLKRSEHLSPTEQANAHKAAVGNQAWLKRQFSLGDNSPNKVEGSRAENTDNIENNNNLRRTFHLPSWATLGEHEKAKADPSDEIAFQVSPGCEDFDHTIRTPDHGCQVNEDTFLVFCNFNNLRVDKSKIISDQGGEPLDKVMGREEWRELPQYQKGAFTVPTPPRFEVQSNYRIHLHYLADVLNTMVYPTKKNKGNIDMTCDQTWSGVTLFITRYEYVNLYHTMTDWWNAYFVLPPNEKVRLVFLDAHAQGNLDPVWSTVFGEYTYVQHLPANSVCFERAVFVPPGYLATLFPAEKFDRRRCPYPAHAKAFTGHVLESYHLQNVQRIPGKIVIIDRKPYVAHPRSRVGRMDRVLPNLSELRSKLIQLDQVTSVEIVQFETMTFAEQVRTVRQAHVLIGNHGAGLSHVLFMDRKSHLLEFSLAYMDFFIYMSEFAQVQHTVLDLDSYDVLQSWEIQRCVSAVQRILADYD